MNPERGTFMRRLLITLFCLAALSTAAFGQDDHNDGGPVLVGYAVVTATSSGLSGVSPFGIWGSRDALLYAANRSLTPNSSGVILQLDYTPWGTDVSPLGPRFNVRIGAQYTAYARFDGGGSNYDGLGHNASDNNTFRLFTWFEF